MLGRYWAVVVHRDRLGMKAARFGLGRMRWVPVDDIERLVTGRQLLGVWSWFDTGSPVKSAYHLTRAVSDRLVLEVPLDDENEAMWLSGSLMKDLMGLRGLAAS